MYREQYLPSIEIQSARDTVRRAENLFSEFYDTKMVHFTAELIDRVIVKKVQLYKLSKNLKGKRSSFKNEVEDLEGDP